MKDIGMPSTSCGIEFGFLPDNSYRNYDTVKHLTNHPVHPITLKPHLSPLFTTALTSLADDDEFHINPLQQVLWHA